MEKFEILSNAEKKFILKKDYYKNNKNYQYVLKSRIKKKVRQIFNLVMDTVINDECETWFKILITCEIEEGYKILKMKYPEFTNDRERGILRCCDNCKYEDKRKTEPPCKTCLWNIDHTDNWEVLEKDD